MKDLTDVLKLWTKNKMFDYELLIEKEGFTIYHNGKYYKDFVCYSKNPNAIYKAIQIIGGQNGIK